jgi:hypothetical protein
MTDLRRGRAQMHNPAGLLGAVGFFGLIATAHAQTAPRPTASTQFDGTYAFVSATTLNETYLAGGTRLGQCPERKAESLTIVRGQTQYSSRRVNGPARLKLEGTVGSQGELAMRRELEPEGSHGGSNPGL